MNSEAQASSEETIELYLDADAAAQVNGYFATRHFELVVPHEVAIEDIAKAIATGLSDDHRVAQSELGAIIVQHPERGELYAWIGQARVPGKEGSALLEVVGPESLSLPLASTLAQQENVEIREVTLADPGESWTYRQPADVASNITVIDAPVTELTLGPWLAAVRHSMVGMKLPIAVRTPEATTLSPIMRRYMQMRWVMWVRETEDGPVEGLSGFPLAWHADGRLDVSEQLFAAGAASRGGAEGAEGTERAERAEGSDADLPAFFKVIRESIMAKGVDNVTLVASVLHPIEDAADVGLLTERIVSHIEGVPAEESARYGYVEGATTPWNRTQIQHEGMERSPEPTTWCISSSNTSGFISVVPTAQGIMEEISIDAAKSVNTANLWESIQDLLPLGFSAKQGQETLGFLAHESMEIPPEYADDIDELIENHSSATEAPFGYRGFLAGE